MALGQVSHHNAQSAWKRQELSDLRAALTNFQVAAAQRRGDDSARRLYVSVIEAYNEGWPVSVVAWAAQRAWAQGTPKYFRAILINHGQDAFDKLQEVLSRDRDQT